MINKLAKWLNLTEQQAKIIGIIHNLEERKSPTNPVNIEKEYFKETKTFIQKSNLFTQLKLLQSKNLIIKNTNSHYLLNLKGIQEAVFSQKKELTQEVEEITKFASDTQAFFEKVIKPSAISVTYLKGSELYNKITFYLKNASAFYVGCDFPHYAYSFALCDSAQETAYVEMLTTKLYDKNFSLYCLSPYRVESLSSRLHNKHNNKELIKGVLKNVYENAKKMTIKCENIDLRKTMTPFDFALIENPEEGNVLFMFLKDSKGSVTGGIFINSYETIKQTKQHFLSQMGTTSSLKKENDFPEVQDYMLLPLPTIKNKKLIAFDVNRIFTTNHTTVELANIVGREKEVLKFIIKQIEGTLSMQEAILQSAKLLKGLETKEIKKIISHIPLNKNVKKGIQELKNAGHYIVAISSGYSQIIRPICEELGIDEIYCNVLEEKDGKITGEVLERNVLTDDVKYYIVKYVLERLSIPIENSIGVGDGYSDIPMLKATKKRICFNPSKKMETLFENKDPAITHLIKGNNFLEVTKEILSEKEN
jgi:phosphoserine phosphatase SerB